MHVTFYGAVREVTGSMHLLTTDSDRILMDCGMFQGRRKESMQKNQVLPFDPRMVTNMILSHAHIDHSGRIPLLVKNGFNGRVVCTRATQDASEFLLMDSAHIQESDANYLNYKTMRSALQAMRKTITGRTPSKKSQAKIRALLKKDRHELKTDTINELMDAYRIERVQPLYTISEAEQALRSFDGYPYRHTTTIGKETTCTFYDAGHILGSAISVIAVRRNGRTHTVGFTGDLGRFGKPILKDPTVKFDMNDRRIDLLIMESTYGDRVHDPVTDLKPQLRSVLVENAERRGTLLIPSFAYGRTQDLLYVLHELYNEGQVPKLPVYIDSPLATRLTKVFGEHPEVYDALTHDTFLKNGENPFMFKEIHFVQTVEESMALNRDEQPHIVISASGMCEAGRILHHLRHKIHNPKNTILIVGFMAANTLGRRIQELGEAYEANGRQGEPPVIKFLNKSYPLKARVVRAGGFSAHGDREEMTRFLKNADIEIGRIAVVHGEEDQSLAFARHLEGLGYPAVVPRTGESIPVLNA